jgi:hypothetical protein
MKYTTEVCGFIQDCNPFTVQAATTQSNNAVHRDIGVRKPLHRNIDSTNSRASALKLKQPLSLTNALEFKKGVIVVCIRGIKRP